MKVERKNKGKRKKYYKFRLNRWEVRQKNIGRESEMYDEYSVHFIAVTKVTSPGGLNYIFLIDLLKICFNINVFNVVNLEQLTLTQLKKNRIRIGPSV